MNILVSNDDGVSAKGLSVLVKTLSRDNNVFVLAPDKNRSAVSNCFSLFSGPLKVCKVAENVYSCSGTPVDCAISALTSDFFNTKFDVVVSGINRGANIGRDIIYSGTCSVARQAVFMNVPGIAVSVDCKDTDYIGEDKLKYEAVAEFVSENLENLIKLCSFDEKAAFVNINACSLDSYKGWKYTEQLSSRDYGDKVDIVKDGDSFKTVFHASEVKSEHNEESDYSVCKEGYISVSRVYADVIGATVMDDIKLSL